MRLLSQRRICLTTILPILQMMTMTTQPGPSSPDLSRTCRTTTIFPIGLRRPLAITFCQRTPRRTTTRYRRRDVATMTTLFGVGCRCTALAVARTGQPLGGRIDVIFTKSTIVSSNELRSQGLFRPRSCRNRPSTRDGQNAVVQHAPTAPLVGPRLGSL